MKAELLRERYEPLEIVGRGGEGEVIRALDHLHARQVALKVRLVPDDASRKQLLSEARLLLSLSPHPGLPLVREDFFVDDRYVIAMDWIEGTDLEELLELEGDPGLDPALVIGYLEQGARALEHLHTHDPAVVHGDVKPANLIRTDSGRIVLVDFGLSSTPTDELRRAGTAGFVAPEVAAGARPTPTADVYSLAATACALLTGEPPSVGSLTWGAIERERIPALERIVRSNLATDPARRDRSVAEFVARLRRWWGAGLPEGTISVVLADLGAIPARNAEDLVEMVAREHRGHCVAPVDDGPLIAAFESARDAFDTARELAGRFGARVVGATGEAHPRGGRYHGDVVSTAARLIGTADPGEVLIDDGTAEAVGDVLPADIGLAEIRPAGDAAANRIWVVIAPGLATRQLAEACPYRGLMAFQPEDGELFFGREEIVSTTAGRLLADGFVAVVGASGSGKSSMVRAGLIPAFRLAREGRVEVLTPGTDPETELRRALGLRPALIVVDQLEEAFTLCADEGARSRFVDTLMDLHQSGTACIVLALRADFYGRCAEYPRLAAALAANQCLLGPMQPDELRRAIDGPARAAGLRLEPGLIDTMLADVEGEPGALPLISHALYESWVRRDRQVLTRAGYVAAGGVRGAIAHTAEDVFLGCSEQEQSLMRRMFLQLTELGEATYDTRRRVPLVDLVPEDESHGEATAVLEKLAAARLLVVGDESVEIAHEALIREWPRLHAWLAEDRDELRTLRQLTTAARSWEEAGRDAADLYRGPRLAAAVELAGEESRRSHVESAFLQASRDAQERELQSARRRARRLRALLAVVAAALVAAVITGSLALVQRGNARRTATVAQAGRLAAQSREVATEHPDLGLLLALEAGHLDESVDTRGALLGALEHGSRIRSWLQGFDAPVVVTAFNPSGRLLATVTVEETTLWDTRTWKPVGPPLRSSQGSWEEGVDFSPDGRTLAITDGGGRVELWDVSARKKLRELVDPGAATDLPALSVVRYSPDGKVIASGAKETNHVTLWDAASGRVIGRPIITHPPESGGAQSVSFSPDSTRIAVPGAPGTVGIWEVATGRAVGKPLAIGSAEVEEAIFANDGRTLIASDDSGSVSLVDVATGRRIGKPLSVGDEPAASLDLSPDGRLLATASFEGSVFVWDAKTGVPYGFPLAADTSPVNDVVFSPDGRTLVSSHGDSAVVWDMTGEQAIGKPLGGLTDLTTGVAFSPDGKWLVAGRLDGGTVVYESETRRAALRVDVGSIVTAVAFHPDGELFAVGSIDGKVRLFDPEGAVVGAPLDEGGSAVWQIDFSPDGRTLAVAADPNGVGGFYGQQRQGEVHFWDVDSRRRVGRVIRPDAGSVLSLAFSGQGTLLATGSHHGQLDLWDVADGARHGEPTRVMDDGFLSVAFNPSDRLVAAGGAIGPVRVWRVDDQRPAFPPLSGHTGPVTGATFDPTGSFLATTSAFGGTRLWDPATGLGYGDELAGSAIPDSLAPTIDLPFLGLRNAFSPDGKLLAVAAVNERGMVWEVDPAVWRTRACAIVGRNLSREEWELYLPSGKPYRPTCSEWPAS